MFKILKEMQSHNFNVSKNERILYVFMLAFRLNISLCFITFTNLSLTYCLIK